MRSSNPRILIVVLSGAIVLGISVALIGSLESWMNEDLAVPHSMTGLAQSALFAGNLLGSMAMGWLIYRVTPRRLSVAALILMVAGSALSGLRSYEAIVAGRLMAGLGYAGATIFFNAAVSQTFGERQAVFLNLYHATFAASAAMTLLFARPLAQALGGWHAAFWVSGLACLVPLVLLRGVETPSLSGDEPFSRRAFFSAMRNAVVVGTLVVMALYTLGEQAMTVFLGTFAQAEVGMSALAASQVAMLFWVGVLGGRLVSAAVSGRLSEPPQLIACLSAMAVVMLFGLTIPQPAAVFAAAFLAGVCAGPVVPLMFSVATRGANQMKGAIIAMVNTANCVGGVIGPVLVGLIADRYSIQAGLAVGAVLLLAGVAPFYMTLRRAARTLA